VLISPAIRLLLTHGFHIVIESHYYNELKMINPLLHELTPASLLLEKIAAIVTVGGDGTILWVQRYFNTGAMPPIIAFAGVINLTSICIRVPFAIYANMICKTTKKCCQKYLILLEKMMVSSFSKANLDWSAW
jgi:hypothetical protein